MKIELRKVTLKDLPFLMSVFPEKELLKNIGLNKNPKEITKKDEISWINKSIKGYKSKKPKGYNLLIIVDGMPTGAIGTHNINYDDRNVEIGYWLAKDYRGRGIMTKAIKLFLKEIYKKFKPIRVVAYTFTFNPRSARVLEKNGFKYEGTRRKVKYVQGKFFDDRIYALIK